MGKQRWGQLDHRLFFHYIDRIIPQLPMSEISSFYPSSVAAQSGLFQTWSETPKTGFRMTFLNHNHIFERKKLKLSSLFDAFIHLNLFLKKIRGHA